MIYLFLTLLCVSISALFAFFEMASVSFNKVRLQYYVSLGAKRALWLNSLLKKPSRLFGTTLIGITSSLIVGAECSRKFYETLHLNPDWAPLTQVPLVVIFGELVPMFAARRHSEQAAMFCVPLMILLSKVFIPITWSFELLSRLLDRLRTKDAPLFLSREEVRLAFEEQDADEFHAAVSHIFQLKNLTAEALMIPLEKVQMAPSQATIRQVRHQLSIHYTPTLLIYHRAPQNIISIVLTRNLVGLREEERVIESGRSPWFVTRDTSVLQLLEQFRHNNQNVAVLLDSSGEAVGILTLDQILATVFGEGSGLNKPATHYIDRTLAGEMLVVEFNREFEASLPIDSGETLSDLIVTKLGHLPVKGEALKLGLFEFTVEEPALLGVKTLSVNTNTIYRK